MKTSFFNLNKVGYDITYFYSEIKKKLIANDLKTFNLGCSFPDDKDKEEYRNKFQFPLLEKLSNDFELDKAKPEVNVIIEFRKDFISYDIRSIFVYGRYNKLSRELPQTIYYCYKCYGKGCSNCNYSGKLKDISVQETISPYLEKEFEAQKSNFIGAGREDVNVRMLGDGRDFLLELFQPTKRSLSPEKFKEIEDLINKENKDVQVNSLKLATEGDIDFVKNSRNKKEYGALIKTESPIENPDTLINTYEVKQQTPKRVSKRRANLVRERGATITKIKKIDNHHFYMEVIADPGLYIKEFISGDDNRSLPSLTLLLKTPCECLELDVLNIIRD